MKKFLVATITSILLLIGIVAGSIYYEKYKIEHIVKSDEAKEVIEKRLKSMDSKALTPEGKIKSYKIDDSYTMKGITEAVNMKLIINDDKDLTVKTALYKDSKRGALEHGAILTSEKLSGLLSDNRR